MIEDDGHSFLRERLVFQQPPRLDMLEPKSLGVVAVGHEVAERGTAVLLWLLMDFGSNRPAFSGFWLRVPLLFIGLGTVGLNFS